MCVDNLDVFYSITFCVQVNEHYLFHGTKPEVLNKICNQGLDFRVAKNTMLGPGVYSAESSTKADQYTGETVFRPLQKLFPITRKTNQGR